MNSSRLTRLYSLMQTAGLDALALNPSPSLTYLTGLHFHVMERPIVLLLVPGKQPCLVLPELETAKLGLTSLPLKGFTYGDNPATWAEVFIQIGSFLNLDGKTIGVEPTRLRFLELSYLQGALPSARFTSAEGVISGLRMQKDSAEIALMRQAAMIAQQALLAVLPGIKPGKTEREIAAALSIQLLKAGSDPEMPFSPIVASGPNSANPHATPTDRKLQAGDLLVIDWGAAYQGYFSDLTRTFGIGQVEPEFDKIARIVEQANAAGRAAGQPEIPAGEIDQAARQVILDAGYGEYFTHRTGHGLGLEGHEHPYIFAENKLILLEGMSYTVEPGIYLPGRGGVRIEDDVVITASGSESLSDLPRPLQLLA
jgi:Xaa-Pro dipeptidase